MTISNSETRTSRLDRDMYNDLDPSVRTLSDYKDNNTRGFSTNTEQDDGSNNNENNNKAGEGIHGTMNSDLVTKASMEIPISWNGSEFRVQRNLKASVVCGIPACVNNGQWSATFRGSSLVRGPMGCASGAMNVSYHPPSLKGGSQLHGGLLVGDQTGISVGGSVKRGKASSLAVSTTMTSTQRQRAAVPSLTTTLSAQHKFDPCLVNGRITLVGPLSSPSSSPLSMILPTSSNCHVSITSLTTHKMQLGLGWNRSAQQPLLSVMVCPKLSAHRRAKLSLGWTMLSSSTRSAAGGSCCWNMGAVLTQSLASKVASLGVGIRLGHRNRLEWIFTWNRGDVSLCIPVVIAQYQTVWMNCLQMAYLSVVSQVIQDAIADLWNLHSNGETNDSDDDNMRQRKQIGQEQEYLKREKARSDAEKQRQLMVKQAQSCAKAEHAKQGLVIRKAVYHVQGGDSWDVTTPLQFWTQDSSLELPSTSKKDMLGFYNVATSNTTGTLRRADDGGRIEADTCKSWWSRLWSKPKANEAKRPTPTLTVQYYYANRLYEICIADDQKVVLPSSQAVPMDRAE